jgi:hypothetical protein
MSVVLLSTFMVLSMSLLQVTLSNSDEVGSSRDDQRAELLAEAGLVESVEAIRSGASGAVGSMAAPASAGGGVFWVTATDLGGGVTQLVATAMAGSGRAAAALVVSRDQAPLFDATLNSRDDLVLANGVVVDSFDSSLGDYATQVGSTTNGHPHAASNGHVSSNGDIYVNGTATVMGNAVPGPTGSVSTSSGSFISGTTLPATEPFAFPPITVPSIPQTGSLAVPDGTSYTLPAGDHGYTSLSIGRECKVLIQGPATIVVDDFVGGKDANLLIDATGGPVTVYCRSSYTHTSGFEASAVTGSPMALAFMIEGSDPIVFPSNTNVRGAYYAPDAEISFSSGNEAWGAFLGKSVTMNADTRFHFDEVLMEYWRENTNRSASVSVLAWYSAPVTPRSLVTNRADPLAVLGLTRNDLRKPTAAWDLTLGRVTN